MNHASRRIPHRSYDLANRSPFLWIPLCTTVFALIASCGSQNPPVITVNETRPAPKGDSASDPERTSAERFGFRIGEAAAHPGSGPGGRPEPTPEWSTPAGWREVVPTQLRNPNFILGDDQAAQCYVTTLSGGGQLININRWRGQMGLEPISDAELGGLEKIDVLGQNVALLDLKGSYRSMSGSPKEGYQLIGCVAQLADRSISVLMVGPASIITTHLERYKRFCAGLHLHGAEPVHSHPPVQPQVSAQPAPATPGTEEAALPVVWNVPPGWEEASPRPMRMVSFVSGPEKIVDCYISIAGGGDVANIQRWYRQMSQPAPSSQDVQGLDKIELLGHSSPLIEIQGAYQGMRGPKQEGYAMLGTFCPFQDQALFVKMVGPAEQVAAQKENFVAFCRSLRTI